MFELQGSAGIGHSPGTDSDASTDFATGVFAIGWVFSEEEDDEVTQDLDTLMEIGGWPVRVVEHPASGAPDYEQLNCLLRNMEFAIRAGWSVDQFVEEIFPFMAISALRVLADSTWPELRVILKNLVDVRHQIHTPDGMSFAEQIHREVCSYVKQLLSENGS